MKIIIEANQRTYKVLGKQKIKDTTYRPMKYVFQVECQDGLLLYNIVTEEMVLLNLSEKNMIQKGEIPFCEEVRELVEKRFLVPIDHDEMKFVKQLRSLLKKAFPQKYITGYTILPTTSCNYCYIYLSWAL